MRDERRRILRYLAAVGHAEDVHAYAAPPLPAPLACQWMDGHPGEGGRFCGAPVVPGSSWCPAHRARVFLPADQQPAPLRWLPA